MILEVNHLCKTYTSPFSRKPPMHAVSDVSFQIKPGEVYALLGPNGAGKSTIIKMIAGLIIPSSGEIRIGGQDTSGKPIIYKHLSAVLEGTRNVYWRLNPIENLYYFANLRGVTSSSIHGKAQKLLEELNIDGKKKNQSQHLSRGMLQKLALGVALVTDPNILLLDEPTLGLDVESSRKMKDKIRYLTKEEGRSVLLTTHQMDLVDELADRVGILKGGKLLREGTLSQLKSIFESHIFRLKIRGDWNIPEEWKIKYSIKELPIQGDTKEIALDCHDKNGVYAFWEIIKKEGLEVVHFYRMEEDLEEIFLRVLES
ncbi:MAG: ABC transporter ATP-binding protein [Leptospiraceae bacterium]|nr:ABC transporter ATP-binding protein [Leptospiraceae bacterium]MCP5512809.1 ABC transporter ATP-binding protein [Leptospiraceae bacterium]